MDNQTDVNHLEGESEGMVSTGQNMERAERIGEQDTEVYRSDDRKEVSELTSSPVEEDAESAVSSGKKSEIIFKFSIVLLALSFIGMITYIILR